MDVKDKPYLAKCIDAGNKSLTKGNIYTLTFGEKYNHAGSKFVNTICDNGLKGEFYERRFKPINDLTVDLI